MGELNTAKPRYPVWISLDKSDELNTQSLILEEKYKPEPQEPVKLSAEERAAISEQYRLQKIAEKAAQKDEMRKKREEEMARKKEERAKV